MNPGGPSAPFSHGGRTPRSEGLAEIRRAIDEIRYADRKRRLRQYWARTFGPRRRGRDPPNRPAPGRTSEARVKVYGYVPRAFLAWIKDRRGRDRDEDEMLRRCSFKEAGSPRGSAAPVTPASRSSSE